MIALVIDRLADGAAAPVAVEVLFAVLGSGVGEATVAVLLSVPVKAWSRFAVTVTVAVPPGDEVAQVAAEGVAAVDGAAAGRGARVAPDRAAASWSADRHCARGRGSVVAHREGVGHRLTRAPGWPGSSS